MHRFSRTCAPSRVLSRSAARRGFAAVPRTPDVRSGKATPSAAARRLQSSSPGGGGGGGGVPPPAPARQQQQAPDWSAPPPSTPTADAAAPTVPNLVLAGFLLAFVAGVFTYSMNAVGRNGEEDPLAVLRAEAEDVRQENLAFRRGEQKMTPEEIERLETGRLGGAGRDEAAPGEEEDASLEGGAQKKKKPWWRFGF